MTIYPLMDLVVRAAVAFLFVYFLTRVIGRRELSSMEPFDLILLVMIGDLVQQGVTQNDFSVTGALLVGGTIALLTVVVSYASFRFPRLRPLLDGEPVIVVEDGEPIDRNLRRNRITLEELAAAGRQEGIDSLEQVRWAVLETNGQLSFIGKRLVDSRRAALPLRSRRRGAADAGRRPCRRSRRASGGSRRAGSRTSRDAALGLDGGSFAIMAAADRELGYAGLKSYTVVEGKAAFVVCLFELESGRLAAVIEADALGQRRTGAASGVAARYLARPGARSLGVIGCGWQAASQVDAIRATVPTIERVVAYCRTPERLAAFCREVGAEPAESHREAGAQDVVVTATTSADPVLRGEWLVEGAFVARGRRERPAQAGARQRRRSSARPSSAATRSSRRGSSPAT